MNPSDFLVDAAAPAGNVPKPDLRDYLAARHIESVMDSDHGGVNDGIANDAAAILAADAALPTNGGIVWFPAGVGYNIGATALTVSKSRTTWRGAGCGDYTHGAASSIVTASAGVNAISVTDKHAVQFEGFAIFNTAVTPTGRGITFTNSASCHLYDMSVRGFDIGVRFAPGATSPQSCFSCSIKNSEIVNNVSINIDAQARTNNLTLQHVSFGGSAVTGLKFVDSATLNAHGDCENVSGVGVDINCTDALLSDVNANLRIHFENTVAGNPTNGMVRLGATVGVKGVNLENYYYTQVATATTPLNSLNGSAWSDSGSRIVGSFTGANNPYAVGADQMIVSVSGFPLDVGRDTNSTGVGIIFGFIQKNASNVWKRFSQSFSNADEVIAGSETGSYGISVLKNNVMTAVGWFGMLSGAATPVVQSEGYFRLGGPAGPKIMSGAGTPEAVVTGSIGDLFLRTDGGASTTLYVKQSGASTNTGWVAK